MATNQVQIVMQQVQNLSFDEQLQLMRLLAEKISSTHQTQEPRRLQYGKYKDTPNRDFATEEDFKLAEWHPTEAELNGE